MYDSMKQSIQQYNRIKKNKQTDIQKSLFRWKLITLGLAVLVIIFAGLLSQIYKQIDKNKVNSYNTSFLPLLLQQSEQLGSTSQIKNLLIGLNSSTQIKFQSATKIYGAKTVSANIIRDQVKGIQNLLYLFRISEKIKFGLFLQKQFPVDWQNELDNQTGELFVIESRNNKAAVLFNLMKNESFRLDLNDQCFTYKYSRNTPQYFSLFQFIRIDATGSADQIFLGVQDGKFTCFANSRESAAVFLSGLTGVLMNPNQEVNTDILNLQIFKLQL